MGKKDGGGQQVTDTSPWGPLQPYMKDFFGQAQQGYQAGGPMAAPFSAVAPFSPQQQQAFQMAEARSQGTPYESAGRNYLTGSLQGEYGAGRGTLDQSLATLGSLAQGGPNPWLDAMFQQGAGQIGEQFREQLMPGINATFGGAGRSGSGLHAATALRGQEAAGRQIGDFATNLYGGAYEADQGRRLQAGQALGDIYGAGQAERARSLSLLPQMAGIDWGNIAGLGEVGSQVQDQTQRLLDERKGTFDFYQNRPYQNLSMYGQNLGMGNGMGSQSVTNQGGSGSRLGSAVGGALAGNAILPGWGALIGGVGGLFS